MHEFALADAVVTTALQVADRERLTEITRLEVTIGELQRIDPGVFELALKEVMPPDEPRLASTEIVLTPEPAGFRCRPCDREFELGQARGPDGEDVREAIHFIPELAHSYLRCPGCLSPDFEVVGGRGVWIRSIEGR